MDWSVQDVFKVIALYRQFPCLWDYKSPEYKRVDLKKNAWDEISKNMNKTDEEVKKKIKNLRSAYVTEKKKVDESKKSGSAADDLYRPHLFYFEEMNFLENVVVLRKTISNLSQDTSKNELVEFSPEIQYSSNFDDSQESTSEPSIISDTPTSSIKLSSAKKARIERDAKFNNALDAILTNINEKETMFSSFGKSIELQLSQLPIVLATKAMVELQQILAKYMERSNNDILQRAVNDAEII